MPQLFGPYICDALDHAQNQRWDKDMISQSNAWADIGPTNNKSQEQMLREILEQSHTAKKHAEWAYQFAREGNLKRAQEHLNQTKTACEQ